MTRAALVVLVMRFVPTAATAQPKVDEHDRGKGGAMSKEELRKEPVTLELDIPYAGCGGRA